MSIAFTAGTGAWNSATAEYAAARVSYSEIASAGVLADSRQGELAKSTFTAARQVDDPAVIVDLVKSTATAKSALETLSKSADTPK